MAQRVRPSDFDLAKRDRCKAVSIILTSFPGPVHTLDRLVPTHSFLVTRTGTGQTMEEGLFFYAGLLLHACWCMYARSTFSINA